MGVHVRRLSNEANRQICRPSHHNVEAVLRIVAIKEGRTARIKYLAGDKGSSAGSISKSETPLPGHVNRCSLKDNEGSTPAMGVG
jgi:hypothetical protein